MCGDSDHCHRSFRVGRTGRKWSAVNQSAFKRGRACAFKDVSSGLVGAASTVAIWVSTSTCRDWVHMTCAPTMGLGSTHRSGQDKFAQGRRAKWEYRALPTLSSMISLSFNVCGEGCDGYDECDECDGCRGRPRLSVVGRSCQALAVVGFKASPCRP